MIGHSYGGMVVTGVADAIPERISKLIYLDAYVPDDNESLLAIRNRNKRRTPKIKDGFIIKSKDIEKIKNASRKIFPIKFSDVNPLTKNLNITKEKIKLMETFWISSGFKASKEKLLSLLS